MLNHNKISVLIKNWSRLSYSKLLEVKNYDDCFSIEFIIDIGAIQSGKFLKSLTDLTVKKHPSGVVSWIGYSNTSQYRKYRLDYIDQTIKENFDQAKFLIFYESLCKQLSEYAATSDTKKL